MHIVILNTLGRTQIYRVQRMTSQQKYLLEQAHLGRDAYRLTVQVLFMPEENQNISIYFKEELKELAECCNHHRFKKEHVSLVYDPEVNKKPKVFNSSAPYEGVYII